MNLWKMLKASKGLPTNDCMAMLFARKIRENSTENATVSGVPCILENSAGKPAVSYNIYGNSVQSDTPTPENPVEVQSVGELVTEGENSGKYEIPVVSKNANGESARTSIFLDEPLRKIGAYANRIDFANRCVVRHCQKIVFDGTENWTLNGNGACSVLTGIVLGDFAQRFSMKCTHFLPVEQGNMYNQTVDKGVSFGNNTADRICIRIAGYSLKNYTDFLKSEYAKGTPVTVYYPLSTPIITPVALPEIPTFDGTTIVEVDTEIQPSYMEITYKSRR